MTHTQALKALIEACEHVRAQAGYFRPRRVHEVYADDWQSWSKQIKEAKKSLHDLSKHLQPSEALVHLTTPEKETNQHNG